MCVLAVHADTLFSLGINIFLNTCIIIMPGFYDKSVEWYVGLLAFEVCKAYVPGWMNYNMQNMYLSIQDGGDEHASHLWWLCAWNRFSPVFIVYQRDLFPMATDLVNWTELVKKGEKKTVRFLFAAKKQEKPNASKRLSRAHGVESARHGRRRAHLWSFSLWQADEKSKVRTRGEGKSAASGPSAAAESPVPIGFWGRWCRGGEARSAPQLTSKVKLPKAGHHDFTVWLEFGTANFWLGCLKGY